jgi:ubiquinone/menaquinone biosynthesis C-methylase UbiE
MVDLREIVEYYNGIAQGYDELYREEQERKLSIIIEELLKRNVRGTLLDVGCGTGFSLDILHQMTGLYVIGVEPSIGMADQYTGTHQLLVCSASALPFPDNHFDAVISMTAIHHFESIEQGTTQIRRVVKKEGVVVVSCLKRSSRLNTVCKVLAEAFVVEHVIEEDTDLVFVCRRT